MEVKLNAKGFKPGMPIAFLMENGELWEKFEIKTISAYAIGHVTIFIDGVANNLGVEDFFLDKDSVILNLRLDGCLRENGNYYIQIHYYGIRDYTLFFPDVAMEDPVRAKRMGMLYEEAEKCFQNAAWLSFAIMSAAVFEHILYFKLNRVENNLSPLIDKAESSGVISCSEALLMRKVKNLRNAIHCNRTNIEYIEKINAMGLKKLIDKIIIS